MSTTGIPDPSKKRQRLGRILLEAALITPAQLEVALYNQQHCDYRIGEVIALHGWVKQETIEFFAETWFDLLAESNPMPIGYYLQMAGLLDQNQVDQILAEQKKLGLRFGAIAVLKGWIKQETMDYFLLNLKSDMSECSGFQTQQISMETVEKFRQGRRTDRRQSNESSPPPHGAAPAPITPHTEDDEDFDLARALAIDEDTLFP
ncbi:MAG: hypothetical protein RLZZ568_2347 [Cyanobacteriota bacterium]|jgi:hypothetical protein